MNKRKFLVLKAAIDRETKNLGQLPRPEGAVEKDHSFLWRLQQLENPN
ncbi:MAG: hypothetical protein HPY90_13945 [Syntrophothermus sp.]|nr:hypothetical protein [Syntrophothermus sp.]NSW84341.1 hypothetical protein [Syntrophothermus sp.]